MYSMSNDENYYCAGYNYDSGYRGLENVPYYPYVGGQPVVYYSHIAQDCQPQRNRVTKKNNPNCFVKAFRWYTQELPSPQQVVPCNNVNIGGFATWLDKKYEEYLQDSQCDNYCPQYRSKQCSFTKSDRTINRIEYPSRKTRKFPRLKSPWKKKRRYINETEKDTLCEKKSFEYILRPQDMSRPASECCQKTSYCIRSDTTFITSKCVIPPDIRKKSKSLMCISKTKDEFEKDIMITNYDVGQCYKGQKSKEKPRIVPNPPSKKPNTENIICGCYKTDLETQRNFSNIGTTKNQANSANCQCDTNYIPLENEYHNVFKEVSNSTLCENTREINKCNIKTRRSRDEIRIVTKQGGVTNQKVPCDSLHKSNTKNVICGCDELNTKHFNSYNKTSRKDRNKTVICQCSTFNFQKDEARNQHNSNVSVFEKIIRNNLNRNEYDNNKYITQRQTSREMIKVVTKCSGETKEMQQCNSRSYRKNRDVICECYQDIRDNAIYQYKIASTGQSKPNNCLCPKKYIQTNDRQEFEGKDQQICRKSIQEKSHQTCCPCPTPLEPKLQQATQIKRSSINCNGMKTLKYKEAFNLKEFPEHCVQTSDHSIQFQEDSFFVKIV